MTKIRFNIHLDSTEDVEAIRAACLAKFRNAGTTVVNWTNEGTSIGKITNDDLTADLFDACNEFLIQKKFGKVSITTPLYF